MGPWIRWRAQVCSPRYASLDVVKRERYTHLMWKKIQVEGPHALTVLFAMFSASATALASSQDPSILPYHTAFVVLATVFTSLTALNLKKTPPAST